MVGLLVFALPALAQSDEIVIEVDGINRGVEGHIIRVASVDVDPAMAGWMCTATAQTLNDASENPGNDFILTSGSSSTEILDWEAEAGGVTTSTGTLVLGESITVDLRIGSNRVSSGGVMITLTCSPPPAPVTTTTIAAETTTTLVDTTTTTLVDTTTTIPAAPAPPTTAGVTLTTEPAPVGGVAAGGGSMAARDKAGALAVLATGTAALLLGGALAAQTMFRRRD